MQTGAEILLKSLIEEGIDIIFGYPGGANLPIYDALPKFKQIRHILVRHEQAAALAADGYARASGKTGVCLATSGPGATNLVTGIANAYMDSIPMIAITGQVPTPLIGSDAFQETDITGIVEPITKHTFLIESIEDIPRIVKEAFYIASTGRPGPVLIDIPKDISGGSTNKKFTYPKEAKIVGYSPNLDGNPMMIKKVATALEKAERPVLLLGHGATISNAMPEIRELVDRLEIPVACTLLGLGALPSGHKCHLGMLGMHGFAHTNYAMDGADLIMSLGSRFDDRITGKTAEFGAKATIIHVDIDPAEIGKNIPTDLAVVGDIKRVTQQLLKVAKKGDYKDWWAQIKEWQKAYPYKIRNPKYGFTIRDCIYEIYLRTEGEAVIATDVGQHQMWAAQIYGIKNPLKWLTSGGSGTMGFGLPAAIGAKFARPKDTVWCLSGDGGFQMNIQELMTIVDFDLDIKIAVLNNSYLGMVRQWQELFYENNYSSVNITSPDYMKLAEAYGIKGFRATNRKEAAEMTEKALKHKGPVLIEYKVEMEDNVYPMVPAGKSLGEVIVEP